jgi:glycosyltransferase involved in cell wall biosynthesis
MGKRERGNFGVLGVPRGFVAALSAGRSGESDSGGAIPPKISVVMPSYNQREFIERSILSVLNQDYRNLEFIIIDGGSTDGTVDIITKYREHLAYWVSEPDQGQSHALNKGFRRATGEIFGWLNSDDLYMPGALATAAAAFSKHPEKGIVHGDWLAIDGDDRTVAYQFSFDFSFKHFKYEGFHLNAQSMFWRKAIHDRFGGFEPGLHNTMDYQMILVFGRNEGNSAFLRVPEVLGCFRRYPGQKTGEFEDRVRREHRTMAERYGYMDKYSAAGRLKRLAYRCRRAWWYWKRGGARYLLDKLAGSSDSAGGRR